MKRNERRCVNGSNRSKVPRSVETLLQRDVLRSCHAAKSASGPARASWPNKSQEKIKFLQACLMNIARLRKFHPQTRVSRFRDSQGTRAIFTQPSKRQILTSWYVRTPETHFDVGIITHSDDGWNGARNELLLCSFSSTGDSSEI